MAYWIIRALLTPFLRACYRIEVEGLEHLPERERAVIAANHLSFIDSLFVPLVVPRRVTFLAKKEYFENPRVAWFFKWTGQIPTDRRSAGGGALPAAVEKLEGDGLVALYPEGTRSPDGMLHRGRTGAVRLAYQTHSPLVPCGIRGTDKVMPRGMKRPRVRRRKLVCVRFGAPIDVVSLAGTFGPEAFRPLTDYLMQRIKRLSGQIYVDAYAGAPPDLEGAEEMASRV